jgi:hypothetical protein
MVSRFKYVTWNVRGLAEKEEELDNILNENNIQTSVITESKKTFQGTKETLHGYLQWSGKTHQRPIRSNDMGPQVNIK